MKQETRTFEMRAASKEFVITGRAVAYGKDSKPLPFIEQVAARVGSSNPLGVCVVSILLPPKFKFP